MTITTLPAAPSRADPANFATKADALLGALAGFVTETNQTATTVNADKITSTQQATIATQQATIATTQAGLATTNGAAQVALATTQAGLATTNGAAQVALATTQAGLTNSDRVQTGQDVTATGISAAAAEVSRIAASKLNLGNKSTAPTLDNQGGALLAGATYYDTALNKWRVWSGSAWVEGISAISGVSSVNGQTGAVLLKTVNGVSIIGSGDITTLPTQTGNAGKVLVTDGTAALWQASASYSYATQLKFT